MATKTRERILETAGELFSEKGYSNTSVRDIAAALGIANPSLYHHFKSKQQILHELMAEPLRIVERTVIECRELKGEQRLRHLIGGLLDSLEPHSGIAIITMRQGETAMQSMLDMEATMEPKIKSLLIPHIRGKNKDIKLTMMMGAVRAAVIQLMHASDTGDDFVKALRKQRSQIIDLAIKFVD